MSKFLILFFLDAYKLFHREQYPKGTTLVYSNWTPRSNRHYAGNNKDGVVVFGNQIVIKMLIEEFSKFFKEDKDVVLLHYGRAIREFTGREDYDVSHIGELHDLGYLPLCIKGLPEGTLCPIGVPALTMYNTDNRFYWLTNYLETLMSTELWAYYTNATIAREYRQILQEYADKTGTPSDFVPWQGHDFSMRGLYGRHASVYGLGHLTSFTGTDTVPAFLAAKEYYNAEGLIASSVPASEHSVQCAHYEDVEGDERAYMRHMLDTYPTGIVSIVCDGFDYWNFVTNILPEFKDEIMARDGRVVIRPDSGSIVDMICGENSKEGIIEDTKYLTEAEDIEPYFKDVGYDMFDCGQGYFEDFKDVTVKIGSELYSVEIKAEILSSKQDKGDRLYFVESIESIRYKLLEKTPEIKGSIEVLWDIFGGTEVEVDGNKFKHLDPHIGLIYGDSVTIPICREICERLYDKGFSTNNLVLGIGSFTYQHNTRDTFGFAMKATYIEQRKSTIKGTGSLPNTHIVEGKEIFKDPKTKGGMNKKSLRGLIKVTKDADTSKSPRRFYGAYDQQTWEQEASGELREIFRDGKLLVDESLDTIRERIKETL